ncbi:peptidase S1 and S6 chymotrypsin/Hap [Stanieria cyanosphaera PCC 7437]|uniref:Peptidase S1 and S6 chymotrypsin/Hap n=1 Tax=Stanieria cyanosphaera (strain ATCC 29371 / PCC 7437) TaxID=111780 RepID=K9Y0F1_STAC7|nr:serine protease [Stanieria cyanosphaera]AFZ37774.1 peptidase S1 and S6 chymotrypsin/Hap [Stanieria cyanosphaera PCC 7437]
MDFKPQAVKLLICLASIGLLLPGDVSRLSSKTLASASPHLLLTQITHNTAEITVRVWGIEALGSGIIINHQGSGYTVVTNQHVLRAGKAPYQIQTSDGKIHQATVVSNSLSKQYDLALLRFRSNQNYKTARLGNSADLKVGEPIFAAGFPAQIDEITTPQTKLTPLTQFTLKTGRIAVILDKALEEGYQIGYTNDVKKGMSGGPLVNSRGEVVGINGKHAYPLWEAPDFFADGSQPCPPLQELITRSSLAIPVEKITEIQPNLQLNRSVQSSLASEDAAVSVIIEDSEENGNTAELIFKMQAEAEAKKNCRELPGESDPSEAKQ